MENGLELIGFLTLADQYRMATEGWSQDDMRNAALKNAAEHPDKMETIRAERPPPPWQRV